VEKIYSNLQPMTKFYDSPKREKFTKQLIEYMVTGKGSQSLAYIKAGYKAKDIKQASANASKLKKHPQVQKELKKFKEFLLEYAPPKEVAKKMAEMIFGKDKRVSDSMIEKWLKIYDQYPAQKTKIQGLFAHIEK